MKIRAVTAALVAGAAIADTARAHELAYYLLVAAVPAAAVAALVALGAILDRSAAGPADRLLAILSGVVLPFLLLAAAVRAPQVLDRPPPAVGVSALVGCLGVFALQALVVAASVLGGERLAEARRPPARERQPARRAA